MPAMREGEPCHCYETAKIRKKNKNTKKKSWRMVARDNKRTVTALRVLNTTTAMRFLSPFRTTYIIIMALTLAAGLQSCNTRNIIDSDVSRPSVCQAPAFLQPGDKVALLSPSYYCDTAEVRQAAALIESWGYVAVVGKHVGNIYKGKYAGTAEERLEDLRRALDDPDIKAILCNRGGYGTLHFINTLPVSHLAEHPKWIVGFSDITTLLAMETNAGLMSIHGIMGGGLARCNGEGLSAELLRDMLRGVMPRYHVAPHPYNQGGYARGILVGGNLCTFAPLSGTEADLARCDNFILFIEEVGENYRNIDRLFNSLVKRGMMERCRGVVLGDFTELGDDLEYSSVEELLHDYLKQYNIPVMCGLHAGHGDINLPLMMGAEVELKVDDSGATLTFVGAKEERDVEVAGQ